MELAFIAFIIGLAAYMAVVWYWINYSSNPVLRRYAWGTCGGAITGLQNFLKDSLTIGKAVKDGSFPWFFPLFIVLAGATAFLGLLMLTACMKRYDATYSASSFVGSFVVSASIMSAIHYQTFKYLVGIWNYILYPSGLIVLMIGVYLLVMHTHEDSGEGQIDILVEPVRKDSDDSQVCS